MKKRESIAKVIRYIRVLGIHRTIVKVLGRLRLKNKLIFKLLFPFKKNNPQIAIIGCGQFSFSTIAYFLSANTDYSIKYCYDISKENADSFATFYNCKSVDDIDEILNDEQIKFIYIASDHFSHSYYAIESLKSQKKVHLEKPIAVTEEQFLNLLRMLKNTSGTLVAGYNRPFSQAINIIDNNISNTNLPLSSTMTIFGHKISENHWYRQEHQGTRICGNVGHWLDLAIHLMSIRGRIPNKMDIKISWADMINSMDDDISISLSTDCNDIINITLTSRSEPFEGINEEILLQCGDLIAKIDDFRSMQFWKSSNYKRIKFSPKDVGHSKSIRQITNGFKRDWNEVVVSTILMLKITNMVQNKISSRTIFLGEELEKIQEML